MSPKVGVVGQCKKHFFWSCGLWSGVSLGCDDDSWRWFLGLGVHEENVLCKGNRAILKAGGWRLKSEVLMTS